MRHFYIATEEEIKRGETTDVYFQRTRKILKTKKLDKVRVTAEITSGKLPREWKWGVLCGIEEEAKLLEGYPINVYAMPEGSIFYPISYNGVREPVIVIEGPYEAFAHLETAILGLICQASGVATAAARIKKLANDKPVYAFGIRRMHPAIAPMLDRAAYIGGFNGVSGVLGAKLMGIKPAGTMPHALIIVFNDQVEAWKAFDEIMPPEVPRIALVDTFYDEKIEAIMAAEALKDRLFAVRLDTPSSRKGNFADIIREVRWELDIRGYKHVKIFVSGGINEENIENLIEAGADAFGVGTSVSNAPTIDFAMDIVEVEGKPNAKRGKMGGRKQVWRCKECLIDIILPVNAEKPECPKCNRAMEPMLKPLIKEGKIVAKLPSATEIRKYVLEQLKKLEL
ncbi:MAG: nicotinate phosphoribosyltransferase [archaeon GB-1867-035]|nr:nicotinate phosphoribosyltransferase [Candidatus Culexmicrobium profundum]